MMNIDLVVTNKALIQPAKQLVAIQLQFQAPPAGMPAAAPVNQTLTLQFPVEQDSAFPMGQVFSMTLTPVTPAVPAPAPASA